MIWRVRDRSTLRELQRRGRRGRSGPVLVTFLPGEPPPRLAFAITRKVGSAVIRNRVRRQLRESFRTVDRSTALRGGSYLLGASPAVSEHSFADLTVDLRKALERAGATA